MSISFFIVPFDSALWKYGNPDPIPTTDLCIDPDEYSRQLLKRWPRARKHAEQWSW